MKEATIQELVKDLQGKTVKVESVNIYGVRNCKEITHQFDLSKCPSAASENLDAARCACDFLLCR